MLHKSTPIAFRVLLCATLTNLAPLAAQSTSSSWPERAIRRDIPMTNAIRAAMAAGSRDSSGRPTSRYWQLRTDYAINVRLDVATSRLHGSEKITLINRSPSSLPQIVLRLDANHFIGKRYRLRWALLP